MRFFITGICGFVGSELALRLLEAGGPGTSVVGIDNLVRAGSHTNLSRLRQRGVTVMHGDMRVDSDLESLPPMDWIIDAAALPSVLSGVDGRTNSRQLAEHNVHGTVNLLELAKRRGAGVVLLSTSRVYSLDALSRMPVAPVGKRFEFSKTETNNTIPGMSAAGIGEPFPTTPPVSMYGATKLASEILALEYAHAFNLPVVIDRCGVMAGAGQFGTADQGIFSFWIRAYALRRPLKYIGFDGTGRQVRDALHPIDLCDLLLKQTAARKTGIWNVGGGAESSMSLAELSDWTANRFGPHDVQPDPSPRRYDAPWIVMDASLARGEFAWHPARSLEMILTEIADHHVERPDWLDLSR